MTPPPQPKRIALYSIVQDEDGYVSNVPICLCEHCNVNQFLCLKHSSQQSERRSCNYGACEECEHLAKSFVSARKHEREKVLEFAIERLGNLAEILLGSQKTTIYCEIVDAEIQRVKKELRQKDGEL